ncbi:MAG: DUF3120 domain-containing protein [Phormidesmis sp.]
MQVLQSATPQVKDIETLQISNKSSTSSSLSNKMSNEGDSPSAILLDSPLQSSSHPNLQPSHGLISRRLIRLSNSTRSQAFAAAAFLVAVPVFIQAPLVRLVPQVSLAMTAIWLFLGWKLLQKDDTQLWGDLTVGFSWTWLAGAVYWGWFRWDPYVHLPIEAIGLPVVLILLRYGKAKIGNYFYLGSLLGTAITDLYFYCVGLIPYWRALMIGPPEQAGTVLHSALLRMETYQGVGCAIVLLSLLMMLGTIPLRSHSTQWWAFSGAVLSTILVDSLFFVAAIFA